MAAGHVRDANAASTVEVILRHSAFLAQCIQVLQRTARLSPTASAILVTAVPMVLSAILVRQENTKTEMALLFACRVL
jgi:hypothetical protein